MRNRGSIDPVAWVNGLMGFVICFLVWSFSEPIVQALMQAAVNLYLPDVANNLIIFTNNLYEWGLVFNAGIWLLYILLSSIRQETQYYGIQQ